MEVQAAQAPAAGEMIILQNKRHGEKYISLTGSIYDRS